MGGRISSKSKTPSCENYNRPYCFYLVAVDSWNPARCLAFCKVHYEWSTMRHTVIYTCRFASPPNLGSNPPRRRRSPIDSDRRVVRKNPIGLPGPPHHDCSAKPRECSGVCCPLVIPPGRPGSRRKFRSQNGKQHEINPFPCDRRHAGFSSAKRRGAVAVRQPPGRGALSG